MEGNALNIKNKIESSLSIFLEDLDESGIDIDSLFITVEYNDGFNYVKLEDDEIEI